MKLQVIVYIAIMIFVAFVAEHLPLPEVLYMFQPAWIMLVVTALVLFAPHIFTLWLALPLGLMMDVEQDTLLGLHVILIAFHIFLLQVLYRRMYLFNVLQQAGVLFLMIMAEQIIHYWAVAVLREDARPVLLVMPALFSAILWPWVYAVGYRTLQRLQRG